MRYACLIYLDGGTWDGLTEVECARLRRESRAYEAEIRRSGHLVSLELLASVRAATTLRVRDGRRIAIDGPATESDEGLSCVLVIEARDLNEAMRVASGHPSGRLGSIEIRPIRRCPGNARGHDG